MARFLIDAQLPPALATRLRETGFEAVHIAEIGLGAAADKVIAAEAERRHAVLVTKDEDFADLLSRGAIRCQVLWLRIGNTTNEALWRRMELLMADIAAAFDDGERIIEIAERPRLVR